MSIKEYLYTKVIPSNIISKWEEYKNGKLLFRCLPTGEFFDNGSFLNLAREQGYYSQYGQDFFIDRILFNGKNGGYFIDIGANHPIRLNNTYYFEQKGWNGIAFEPQQRFQQEWMSQRQTKLFGCALGASEGVIDFVESQDDDQTCSGIKGVVELSTHSEAYEVQQRRLGDILNEQGVDHVDFVSIDVEGYEYEVLKGIDFDKVDITCFVIENNKQNELPDMELRTYMKEKGYDFVGRIVIDDIYVKHK